MIWVGLFLVEACVSCISEVSEEKIYGTKNVTMYCSLGQTRAFNRCLYYSTFCRHFI